MDLLIFSILTNFLYFCSGSLIVSNKNCDFNNQFYIYFIGTVLVSFISLLLNFFIPLEPLINSIIYLIIIIAFTIKTKFILKKKHINFLAISSFITFLLIAYSTVNRPDAGLYHLPYIAVINENKIIFGLSNIHFRFGHTSVLQYLSAINNNYIFLENGISIPLASIVSFFYLYFFYDIWKIFVKKKIPNLSNFFSLFVLIYIAFKITRYSEFGNDAVAHLTFFYLISYLLKKNIKEINFKKILIISIFTFVNKPTLGLIFICPLAIFFLQNSYDPKKIFYSIFSFPTLFLYLWLIKNIIISGCFIYPLKITCVENLPWTNVKQIVNVNIEIQAWTKAWPDRIDQKITMEEFNKNFNWLNAWGQKHLIHILSIIIPYLTILFLIIFYIKIKLKSSAVENNKDLKTRFFLCTIISGVGILYFFFLFPLYRFGYSYIVTFLILIIISIIKNKVSLKENIPIFKFIFIICFFVIITKQGIKIFNNSKNTAWPNIYTLGTDDKIYTKKKININDGFFYYLADKGDQLCMYSKSPCTSLLAEKSLKYSSKKTYSFLTVN
jgi:hypothetical protein